MATVTKSIGSSSRDYSTIAGWIADLDNTGVYSSGDDAVGECYADSTFNETNGFGSAGGTVGLNSITLSVASGERHDGTDSTGVLIDGGGSGPVLSPGTGVDLEIIEWVRIHNWSSTTSAVRLGASVSTIKHIARNCVIYGNGVGASNSGYGRGCGICLINRHAFAANCIIYGGDTVGNYNNGIRSYYSGNDPMEVYNCTIYDFGHGGIDIGSSGTAKKCKNVVSVLTSGSTDFIGSYGDDTYADYNASSDTSAPGSHSINTASASDFVSTTGGSEDLHLASGAVEVDAGNDISADTDWQSTTLSDDGVPVDIDGTTRNGTWDIGADEYVSSG